MMQELHTRSVTATTYRKTNIKIDCHARAISYTIYPSFCVISKHIISNGNIVELVHIAAVAPSAENNACDINIC